MKDDALLTSPTLLRGIRSDDNDEWELSTTEFYRRYRGFVFCICRRLRMQDADIEIVMNNVLGRFFDRAGKWTYRPDQGGFRKFFSTAVHNAAVDLLRRRNRQRSVPLPDGTAEGGGAELPDNRVTEAIEQAERGELLLKACRQVQGQAAAPAWQAWQNCVVGGQDPKKVARFLDVSLATVYNYCKQVSRMVRECYELMERE